MAQKWVEALRKKRDDELKKRSEAFKSGLEKIREQERRNRRLKEGGEAAKLVDEIADD